MGPSCAPSDPCPPDSRAAIHSTRSCAGAMITTYFQPIVELDTAAVVGYEALSRGPAGPLQRPDLLFDAARAGGRLTELDELCRRTALTSAVDAGIFAPSTLFVNVEPEVLETARARRPARARRAGAGRAADRPGDHRAGDRGPPGRPAGHRAAAARGRLAHRARRRRRRRHVAGLHAAAAARRRQARPAPGAAAARPGGRRDHERGQRLRRAHRRRAAGRGHRGRAPPRRWPAPSGPGSARAGCSAAPRPTVDLAGCRAASCTCPAPPAQCRRAVPVRLRAGRGPSCARRPKPLLVEVSKHLEREAMRFGRTCVVLVDLPGGAALHRRARPQRYRDLVEQVGFVAAHRRGAAAPSRCPACAAPTCSPTTRCAASGTWSCWPRTSPARCWPATSATAARTTNARFEFALTYDRDVVVAAAQTLLSRVLPEDVARLPALDDEPVRARRGAAGQRAARRASRWQRADAAPGPGRHDQRRVDRRRHAPGPAADLRQRGLREAQRAAGRGRPRARTAGCCRGRRPIARRSSACAPRSPTGQEVRETLVNYRGPQRDPWWNEIYLAPVFDELGRLTHYIGVQSDVTARVRGRARPRGRAAPLAGLPVRGRGAGLPRPADRAAQPPAAAGAARRRHRAGRHRRHVRGRALPRPRQLQGDQRPLRPRRRRRGPEDDGRAAAAPAAARRDLIARHGR